MTERPPVIIVGGGLSGLCAALTLQAHQVPFRLLEGADRVGGRLRTDRVEGFLLDRGFQVLLTGYPEAQRVLDYPALKLHPFAPGALVRWQGQFHTLSDPWRVPQAALATLKAPVGSLKDKLTLAKLRARLLSRAPMEGPEGPPNRSGPSSTTAEALRQEGFSAAFIDRFFRPFLGGIFLDPTLALPKPYFEFLFQTFARGDTAFPEDGIEAIPRQLAQRLPASAITLNCPVVAVQPDGVTLADGTQRPAQHVLLAADGPAAARLLPDVIADPGSRAVTAVYFAAPKPPITQPMLVLNGEGDHGPINNLCVPSQVCPSYAPEGQSLISCTVLGDPPMADSALFQAVQQHAGQWFGVAVSAWRPLRVVRVRHAQPIHWSVAQPHRLPNGLYLAGDFSDTPSIQGAMRSGRLAAEQLMAHLLAPSH